MPPPQGGCVVPDFQQYIGVRYSGRKDPGDPIREIKVFAALEHHEISRETTQGPPSGRWSRRAPAEWLLGRITSGEPAVVGIDHAFSFPQTYMDRHSLKSWAAFLEDFEESWPTDKLAVRELL